MGYGPGNFGDDSIIEASFLEIFGEKMIVTPQLKAFLYVLS